MPVLVSEKYIDQKVVTWFKDNYPEGVCIKLSMAGPMGTAGWPDRLFLAKGRAAFVEMKAPGMRATELQTTRIQHLRRAGHHADWFDDAAEACAWLRRVLEDAL